MRVTADKKVDILDKNNVPSFYCKDGDTVVFETSDCFDSTIHYDGSVHQNVPFMHNPATGPVYIEGAEPGDILCVEIIKIKTNDYGIVGTAFGSGGFAHVNKKFSAGVFDIKDGYCHFHGRKLELNPMIGVIGVAPEGDGVLTVSAGSHGGNMDCTQVKEGAKLYFPVAVDGALFATGDLHIVMGDGEVVGYGVEAGGEVTVKFNVIKGEKIENPIIHVDNKVMVVASAENLDKAADLAVRDMHKLLVKGGWSDEEAGMLMSLKCDLVICQIVNPVKTVRAVIDADLMKK